MQTTGLYLSLFFGQKNIHNAFCAPHAHPLMSLVPKQGHLVVGHILIYILSKSEVNPTDGSRDISTCVTTLSVLLIWQLSDHQGHGLRTDSTTTDHLVCQGHSQHNCQCTDGQNCIHQPAHLWLGLERCIPLLLHILTYPGELAPPQLHHAWQQGPSLIYLCSSGSQIPGDACTMDAYQQQRGTESDQGESFCLPWSNTPGNDTWCQCPCVPWRTQRCCGQAGRGPSRSHCMHQDPDGPLQDDQWQALQAWAALPWHPSILQWGEAPWETYGKTIQDIFLQASWCHCEPLCHLACPRPSLPQCQTCGCNLPGWASSSPHQPQ